MIKVQQRCCEWQVLANVISTFCDLPEQILVGILEKNDWHHFKGIGTILADNAEMLSICGSESFVLFSEEQVGVLVKIIDWFDGVLLYNAERLEQVAPQDFEKTYAQAGLIKRNLIRYANPSEIKYETVTTPKNCINDAANLN